MKIEAKHITEIAFLRFIGFEVVGRRVARESQRTTVYFILESDMSEETCKAHRQHFQNGRSTVEPRRYSELVRETTDLLFERLRQQKREQ